MKGMAMAVSVNWKNLKMPNSPTTGEMTAASNRTMKEAMRPTRTISWSRGPLVDELLVDVGGEQGGGRVHLALSAAMTAAISPATTMPRTPQPANSPRANVNARSGFSSGACWCIT